MFRLVPLLFAAASLLLAPIGSRSAGAADTPKFCEGRAFGLCFTLLLQQRCASYADYNLFSRRENHCEASVAKMIATITPVIPAGETNVVIFPRRIGDLLTNPAAFTFLRDLPGFFAAEMKENRPFRLWAYAVAKAGGNEDLALEWLAILFQDTDLHENTAVENARVNFGTKFERRLTSLERNVWIKAIEAVSFKTLTDSSVDSRAMYIRPYPGIDEEFLTKGFYHFYFSAYVARHLQKTRRSVTKSGIDMNGFAPFLLNAFYEMHIDIEENLSPFEDPKPFSPQEKDHSLRDTYTGYLGALFGLGGTELVAKADPFPLFSKRFARDPRGTMESLYLKFRPIE